MCRPASLRNIQTAAACESQPPAYLTQNAPTDGSTNMPTSGRCCIRFLTAHPIPTCSQTRFITYSGFRSLAAFLLQTPNCLSQNKMSRHGSFTHFYYARSAPIKKI